MFVPDVPRFVAQQFSVLQLLDLVDPDQPVLGGERLLQVLELDVLVADFSVARPIKAGRRPEVQLWTQMRSLLGIKASSCILCLKCHIWKSCRCVLEIFNEGGAGVSGTLPADNSTCPILSRVLA